MPRYPRIPKKKSEIPGCPFRAGDYVRKHTTVGGLTFPERMIVTSVSEIPDLDDKSEGYGPDVRALPYWIFGTDIHGIEHKNNNGRAEHRGAIWVGFVELDPFLGLAKRAVMDA